MKKLMIPFSGLNETKAHEHEGDEVYTRVNEEPEGDVQRKDHSKHGIGMIKRSWLIAALGYGAFLLGVSYFGHPNPPKLVTLNVQSIVTHFSNALAENQGLSEKQKDALAEQFSHLLNQDIDRYQEKHHVEILKNTAAISGVPDITDSIQSQVSADLTRAL